MNTTLIWRTDDDPGMRYSLDDSTVFHLVQDSDADHSHTPFADFPGVSDIALLPSAVLRLTCAESGRTRLWRRDTTVAEFSCYLISEFRPGHGTPKLAGVVVAHAFRDALEHVSIETENAVTAYRNVGAPDPAVLDDLEQVHKSASRDLGLVVPFENARQEIGNTAYMPGTYHYRSESVWFTVDRLRGEHAADALRYSALSA